MTIAFANTVSLALAGHYTASVLKGGTWFLANDAVVSEIAPHAAVSSDSYVFFYCQTQRR